MRRLIEEEAVCVLAAAALSLNKELPCLIPVLNSLPYGYG